MLRAAREQTAHHGGLLSRLLESFPGQLQGRPRGFRRRGRGDRGAGDDGLCAHGTGDAFTSAVAIGAGGSRSRGQGSCTSGKDSLALLVGELGNCSGTQLRSDEEQLNQIAVILLLEATPGRSAREVAIGNFADIMLLGWHPPGKRAGGLNAGAQTREYVGRRDQRPRRLACIRRRTSDEKVNPTRSRGVECGGGANSVGIAKHP